MGRALQTVVADQGPRILSWNAMMTSALDDLAPQWPREVQMLGAAAKTGLAAQLTGRVERGATPVEAMNGAARWLAAATLYDVDTCRWLARVFAEALGFELAAAESDGGTQARTTEDPVGDAQPDQAALAGIAPEADAAGGVDGSLQPDDAQAAAWAGMTAAEARSRAADVGEITVIAPFVGAAHAASAAATAPQVDEAAALAAGDGDGPASPRPDGAEAAALAATAVEEAASPPAPASPPVPAEPLAATGIAPAPPAPPQPQPLPPPQLRKTTTPKKARRRRGRAPVVAVVVLVGGYFVVADIAGLPPLATSSTSSAVGPTITKINPSVGQAGGGTQVTITGTALSGASITVAGKSVSHTCTATSCSFTAPAGAGPEQVQVKTSKGSATATFDYPSVASSPPAWLAAAFPEINNDCTPFSPDTAVLSGLTTSFSCGDTLLGKTGSVIGFQYDNAVDYQAGVVHFNGLYHFDAITAGTCPPLGSSAGQGWWFNSSFPEIQDQSLQCFYTSGPTQTSPSGKTELFLFPTEDAFVMVWGPGLPWGALQDIWCQNCVGPQSNTGTVPANGQGGAIGPKTQLALPQLLPADVVPGADCKSWPVPKTISPAPGGSLSCTNADLGGNGTVIGYKWSNSADYQKGLAALNKSLGFNPTTASASCPPTGTANGEIDWANGARYPRSATQVLECLNAPNPTSGGTPGPLYVEAIPTQNALLEFSASLLSWAQLNTWYLSPADGLL